MIYTRTSSGGVTTTYQYYDAYTWIVGALVLAWLIWILLQRYKRLRAMRRPPETRRRGLLERVVKIKRELSSNYLATGLAANIHAVGVGKLGDEYCIQVFVKDVNDNSETGPGMVEVPNSYRGVPVVLIEMAAVGFLSDTGLSSSLAWEQYPNGIREQQEVIVGGISGANTNLTGASGTIGYFCTRKSNFRRRKEIHVLSNSHVFADLKKAKVDDSDLIMQPSPGEPSSNRPIGTLVRFSPLKFDGDVKEPNHVDSAIAKLWGRQQHEALIPLIGAVKGYVKKNDVKIGEAVRKFGRTTGYSEGRVFSIYLDIWIKYDRTGQAAFFQDQILIEPALPQFTKFVSKGDSGSLLVDANQFAVGLIFAGTSEMPEALRDLSDVEFIAATSSAKDEPGRIENYGVANPISEVLDRLKIDLLV